MDIKTLFISVDTKGFSDIVDITDEVQNKVTESGFTEGNALVFVSGSTAGITTIEYEPGLLKDYPAFFEKICPSKNKYLHDDTWHDGNGYAHVSASLQGCSITVPFMKGQLLLGTWQQIVLVDFDNRVRSRNVIVQMIGK